jgi:hypothetical protein
MNLLTALLPGDFFYWFLNTLSCENGGVEIKSISALGRVLFKQLNFSPFHNFLYAAAHNS